MKLSALRLFVTDIQAARSFYHDVLGLQLTHDQPRHGYCTFKSNGIHIIVESVPRDASPEDQALVGRFVGASLSVIDIQGEYQRLRGLGVEFTGAPEKQFWGGTLATFRDPAGNELQLVQNESRFGGSLNP